jgi:hypothetical protein
MRIAFVGDDAPRSFSGQSVGGRCVRYKRQSRKCDRQNYLPQNYRPPVDFRHALLSFVRRRMKEHHGERFYSSAISPMHGPHNR